MSLTPPKHLPAETRKTFREIVEQLGDRLKPEDARTVEMYAVAWETWRKAISDVQKQGAVVMSGGTPVSHPALAVASQAHAQLLQLSDRLGINPAARHKQKIKSLPALKLKKA